MKPTLEARALTLLAIRDRSRPWYDAGMAVSRKRRIVRRAVMVLAVVMLLVWVYVGSYLAWGWAANHSMYYQYLRDTSGRVAPLWYPITAYEVSDLPLSRQFLLLDMWFRAGGKKTWGQVSDMADIVEEIHHAHDRPRTDAEPK
jgi:hypothetical protein